MKVAVVDYGMGNLGSVRRALSELGADVLVAERPGLLRDVDRFVLPGVGSFADGIAHLNHFGWVGEIHRQVVECGKPFLGICLGMQLLATKGAEGGDTTGLGLIDGEVQRLDVLGCAARIPHVGWNSITLNGANPLFAGVPNNTDFYFVHSYAFRPLRELDVVAYTDYGISLPAAIAKDHIFGTQFHPEKSSTAGLQVLRNFMEFASC